MNEHDILSLWKHKWTHKVSHLKALVSKSICRKFLSPISCHSWEIRWFIFNELTVHSTRSPVKHCPISKRKIFPDSGDWALSSQACARKIWDIRAHPNWHHCFSLVVLIVLLSFNSANAPLVTDAGGCHWRQSWTPLAPLAMGWTNGSIGWIANC